MYRQPPLARSTVRGATERVLRAAMQYFTHVNGELKNAVEQTSLAKIMKGAEGRDDMIHEAATSPHFLVLTGGGPPVTDCQGTPWSGAYVNANGDLTVDLRSDIAAESRAKIVYEYLMQFTDDPDVKESLGFLMTREIAHFQMFTAALADIAENFPPGTLKGDPRYTHVYFNMSNGSQSQRGSWNEGSGPWKDGGHWEYVEEPFSRVVETKGLQRQSDEASGVKLADAGRLDQESSRRRTREEKEAMPSGKMHWCDYSTTGRHA